MTTLRPAAPDPKVSYYGFKIDQTLAGGVFLDRGIASDFFLLSGEEDQGWARVSIAGA